jgi:hypothetical protein
LAVAIGAALISGGLAHAQAPSLRGGWVMSPAQSSFDEAITGPAPDSASLIVTRDDDQGLAYELTERRGDAEVAHAVYTISFSGEASTSQVGGLRTPLVAVRDPDGGVVLRAPEVGKLRVVIRLRRTGPDSAVLEHTLEEANGGVTLERLTLRRVSVTLAGLGPGAARNDNPKTER